MRTGQEMYDFAGKLFPIGRSLTGEGVRETLRLMKEQVPELEICSVPSGTQVFDWTVPKEWEIREGYIEDGQGRRIVSYQENNLHVMGYSTPVDRYVTLEELLPYIDAMNIDLKGFREGYYRKLGGNLETVKQFITRASAGCHVELTTLIVPGENDGEEEMEEEARWIADLSREIPLHVTRFFPQYRMMDRGPTDVGALRRLAGIAGRYLEHVYLGNV